jgi:hypothetical protein
MWLPSQYFLLAILSVSLCRTAFCFTTGLRAFLKPRTFKLNAEFDVKVIYSGGKELTIKASDEETILEAFERYQDLDPQYSCRSGNY